MWRAALKGALGHRARLVITALVVGASVAFVVATLVFTDTLSESFETLFEDSFAGFDLQVRSEIDPELAFSVPAPLDASVLDDVLGTEGVVEAQGSVTGFLALEGPDGTPVESSGPPIIGLTWPTVPSIATIDSGAPPAGFDSVAVDRAVARRADIEVGDTITVVGLGGPRPVAVSGIVTFSGADSAGGATTVFSSVELGQELFDLEGRYSSIEVVADESEAVASRLRDVLAEGIEVVSAEDLARQQVEGFQDAIGFLRTFVLVFAGVALFVGTFVISNIFRVTIAQRTRELAVLRAIGATARQVRRLMLAEAGVISALASTLGALAGLGLAAAIRRAFDASGIPLPEGPLVVGPTPILAGIATGVAVTLSSALVPAAKASRVAPVEAMREGLSPPRRSALRSRILVGAPLTSIGVAALVGGLFLDVPEPLWWVGAGAGTTFIGIAVLAAVMARRVAGVIGRPAMSLGVTGTLARENAMRSPRRTGLTASALMISLALVGLVSILADSASTTADRLIGDRFRSDLIVAPTGFSSLGFSPEVAAAIGALPEVDTAGRLRQGQALSNEGEGDIDIVTGATGDVFELLAFEVVAGAITDLGPEGVAVRQREVDPYELGDQVTWTFPVGGERSFGVLAIYESSPSAVILDMATWEEVFSERLDSQVLVRLADGVDFEAGRAAVEGAIEGFPSIQVQDQEAFRNEATGQIGGIVNVLYALLAVSIVIGTLGVIGTLLLSVVERTRELGILRAIGMRRRQVRRMVTLEAVIIAIFGGVLGTILGLAFGMSVVTAIGDNLDLSLPAVQLSIWLGVAAILGVLAALYPARRAARLDVLAAISYE